MTEKRKVLIVENDPVQYMALKKFLSDKGLGILCGDTDDIIGSYEEALGLMQNEFPDIAVIDIELDGKKDGIDLAAYLKPLNIPVIFLTSNDNYHNLERAKLLLPSGFLSKTEKPYDERNLWNAITMALQFVEEKKQHGTGRISLKVKEMELPLKPDKRTGEEDEERQKVEKIFEWNDILFIFSGVGVPHNYVFICTNYSGKNGFAFKASLNYFEKEAPSNFVRVNGNYLLNAHHITDHYLPGKVYIKKLEFIITRSFSSVAEQKIKLVLGI